MARYAATGRLFRNWKQSSAERDGTSSSASGARIGTRSFRTIVTGCWCGVWARSAMDNTRSILSGAGGGGKRKKKKKKNVVGRGVCVTQESVWGGGPRGF